MQVSRSAPVQTVALAAHPSVGRTPGKMPAPDSGTLRVGSFNVENFFDTNDDPPGDPTKTGDKVPTAEEYKIKLAKLALAIKDKIGAPDVLSLAEVENQQVLEDLLKQPGMKSLGYKAVVGDGNDARGIHVAMIYRAGRVEMTRVEQQNPAATLPDTPYDQVDRTKLFARAPLAIDFRLTGFAQATEGAAFTVIGNHFKSKLGGPGYEPRRVAQGVFMAGLIDARTAAQPTVPIFVVGDFNATYEDGAYKAIANNKDGSERMYDAPLKLSDADRYTYNYRGRKSMLDHFFVTPGAKSAIDTMTIPHFNTYDGVKNKAGDPKVADGVSDHDPLVVDFNVSKLFGAAPAAQVTGSAHK
ncbi:MAG: endonuclease/exonuclease/phosphatase family protein [Thermoleophilia bacterium]|nr:endonuclease/exonuclease/phosphatase family protein [Thermoleophilia bacterium]